MPLANVSTGMVAVGSPRAPVTALVGAPVGFSPLQLPGLKFWLDASQISGLNDGDPVATWSDASGLNNHATQATGSKQPTYKVAIVNGRPVVRFDGVDDALTLTLALGLRDTLLVFAVFATSANTTRQTLIGQNDAAGAFLLDINLNSSGPTAPSRGAIINGTIIAYASVTASANVFEIIAYRRSGAGSGTHLIARNGVSQALTNDSATNFTADGTADIGRRLVAGGQQLAGDIHALIACNAAPSLTQLAQLTGYYSTRTGIVVS